ncbi:lycopene cyclase domain-containing protein [Mumia sp. Pv 4-285]|uniref:lycopene cyclase domain-containing protein n=1 Tax=Mumia qirimensis TaxID=3234852 RepID=UPI00351D854D
MTYAVLALPFLAVAVGVLVAGAILRRPGRRWWVAVAATCVVLVTLTLVFDNLMVAADLFRYDEENLSGLRVGLVPIEDLAWPVVAALGLPGLALLTGDPGEQT